MKLRWVCLCFLGMLAACNSPFERMIPEREYSDSAKVVFGKPKVLYIIVDGARGTSVRNAQASNINSLLPGSIYTWNGLSDIDATTNAANFASMLTGVKATKHGVKSDDFSQNELTQYPVLFERIKDFDPEIRSVVFARSTLLKNHLCTGATLSTAYSDDAAVKSAVVTDLENEESSMIVAQFSGVDEAGKTSGYDLSFPAYKEAILKFDGYVGEMISALKRRKSYKTEKWLVVISSSKGGPFQIPAAEDDKTAFSKPELNTFTIFHNTEYFTRIITKPFLGSKFPGSFMKFSGNLKAVNAAADNSIYNFGDSEFTIELKVKKNANTNYPSMIGKRKDWTHNDIGWNIFLESGYWMFNGRGNKNVTRQVKGADMAIDTWNSIALVCVNKDGKRYIRTFTNGNFNVQSEITDLGLFDNSFPITIGKFASNGSMNGFISDVKIWKVAIPDDKIKQFSCDTYVDPGHPYYDYLISYWPMIDGSGDVFEDQGLAKVDLKLEGAAFTWDSFSDLICSPPASNLALLVPGAVDIPAQIYSWLRIPRQESWLLDGRVWQDQ